MKAKCDIFIEKAKYIHGDLYEYNRSVYINAITPLYIYCKKCKKYFNLSPNKHLSGRGCQKCGIKRKILKKTKTQDEFIKECFDVHGDLYGYDRSVYINAITPIYIYCKKCKKYFTQTPSKHLSGQGCKECGKLNKGMSYSKWEKQGMSSNNFDDYKLYIIEFYNDDERFIKIGKTYRTLKNRFSKIPYKYNIIKTIIDSARNVSLIETDMLRKYKDFKYSPLKPFNGETECFLLDIKQFLNK